MLGHIPVTDRNEDGSATVCSQCERPDECGLAEVAHASGPLHLCGACFDELPACENCGERGGTAKVWREVDLDINYDEEVLGCSLCAPSTKPVPLAPFTSERCPF